MTLAKITLPAFILVFIFAGSHVAMADTTAPLTVDANTVTLWHSDGTACSSAKNDNAETTSARDYVCVSSPTSGTGHLLPTTDGAYVLNGSTQYLHANDDSLLDGQSNFTAEMWINPDSTADDIRPISKFGASLASDQAWSFTFASNQLYFEICTGSTCGSVHTSGTISTGTWQYVVATYDASQASGSRCKIYVNGVDVSTSDSCPSTMLAGSAEFRVGVRDGVGSPPKYDGMIDDIRLSTVTRTSAEISSYYSGAAPAPAQAATSTIEQTQANYGNAFALFLLMAFGVAFLWD